MQKKFSRDKILSLLTKGLVAVFPLFFLPWTAPVLGMDNVGKLNLLWLAVPVLCALALAPMFSGGKLKIRTTPLDLPILAALIVMALSAAFGLDGYVSFFGAHSVMSYPLALALVLALFYFFLVNRLKSYKEAAAYARIIVYDFTVIMAACALVFLAYHKGMISFDSRPIHLLRNLVGSWEDFSVFTAVMAVILAGFLQFRKYADFFRASRRRLAGVKIILASSLAALIFIDFYAAWWCLLAGALFLLAADIALFGKQAPAAAAGSGKERRGIRTAAKKYAIPLFCALLSLNYLLNFYLVNQGMNAERLAKKMQLDAPRTREVAFRALGERPLLGYGPDNFSYAAAFFRDAELNNTPFWHLRLPRGASFVFEILATAGILGLAAWFFFLGSLFYFFLRLALSARGRLADWGGESAGRVGLVLVLTGAIAALVTAQIVYAVNTLLLFLFWLFIALFTVCAREQASAGRVRRLAPLFRELSPDLKRSFPARQTAALAIFFLFSGWVALAGLGAKHRLAEFYFRKSGGKEPAAALGPALKAAAFNPGLPAYQEKLAKIHLSRALDGMKAGDGASLPAARDDINAAIGRARQAIAAAPYSAAAHETLAVIYREISEFSPDSRRLAIAAFKEASLLEPANPVIPVEIGKLYLADGETGEAIGYFRRAAGLKNDYYDAQIGLARAYAQGGMETEALDLLRRVEKKTGNSEIYYELARLYFNRGDFNMAADYFRKILAISPNHANALYGLALSYQSVGRDDEARYYLEKVLRLNPDNAEIMKKTEEMK